MKYKARVKKIGNLIKSDEKTITVAVEENGVLLELKTNQPIPEDHEGFVLKVKRDGFGAL